MSDKGNPIRLWEMPSFEAPGPAGPEIDPVEEQLRARNRGFEQGKAEGMREGLDEARQVLQRAGALLDDMARPYRNLDQLVTQELVQTAMTIARQLVRRELTLDSSQVADAVSAALATLSSLEGEIEIHLNPADIAQARDLVPELLEGRSWTLQEDPDMLPGGCRLKTPVSYVDASVEKQMENMLSGLLEACENSPGS